MLTSTHPSSVSQRIKAFNAFIDPQKVRSKYTLMAENAYRFFRGTCHLFYEDLSMQQNFSHRTPNVWGCGDLHLENFGSYKGRNGFVYFDQNDFDEAMLMPASWELSRMATSIIVAFRSLKMPDEKAAAWVKVFITTYCKQLTSGKAKHIEARLAKGIVQEFLERAGYRKEKDLLRKLVMRKTGTFISDEKHEALDVKTKKTLVGSINAWLPSTGKVLRNYKAVDACHRTAGTGSVGVKRYLILLQRMDDKNNLLLLDMKEARPSVLHSFNSVPQPQWASEAERVVAVQSRSQYATTAYLSSLVFEGCSYTLRELQPEEDKLDFGLVVQRSKDVLRVLKDMAILTASAHLRSSGRQGSAIADNLIAFGNGTAWQEQLTQYAIEYEKKVASDYASFLHDYQNHFFDAGV